MSESSDEQAARTRKNASAILQALASVGQAQVAQTLNVDEATVSRMKDRAEQWGALLARCGLKVVPATMRCYRPEYVDALHFLAREQLDRMQNVPTLDWE